MILKGLGGLGMAWRTPPLSHISGANCPSVEAATRHSGFICPATVCLLSARSAPYFVYINARFCHFIDRTRMRSIEWEHMHSVSQIRQFQPRSFSYSCCATLVPLVYSFTPARCRQLDAAVD